MPQSGGNKQKTRLRPGFLFVAEERVPKRARMGWARLLRRVFDIDLEHCPQCGGEFKIIAAIEESAVIVRILKHLGLRARSPPSSPARPLPVFQAA